MEKSGKIIVIRKEKEKCKNWRIISEVTIIYKVEMRAYIGFPKEDKISQRNK